MPPGVYAALGWHKPFNFHPPVEVESKQVVKPTNQGPKLVNAKQLAPVTGALIAGLIGVQAADCYGWITSVCKDANSFLEFNYPNCQNPTGGNNLYTTGVWTKYEAYPIYEPGQTERARHADTRYCSGLASYLDCLGYPHTINYGDPSTAYFGTSEIGYPPPCEW